MGASVGVLAAETCIKETCIKTWNPTEVGFSFKLLFGYK